MKEPGPEGGSKVLKWGLTVGKNMKLEKNHITLCQADHWVWNTETDARVLRDRALQAWSPLMPL